jgi:hypothetical protein
MGLSVIVGISKSRIFAIRLTIGSNVLRRILTSVGGQQVQCDMTRIMSCGGNLYEYCGGPGFMSLYYASGPLR